MTEVSRQSTEQLPIRGSELAAAVEGNPDRIRARARVHARLFGESESQQFGRYVLLEAVGRGGMGTVWRAHDGKLGREVAIKLLHDGALRRPGPARRQLLAEAALMAKLDHPNVVRVYDVGEHEGELFVAMELVRGKTLRAWQRDRGWRELVDVYRAAGAGLVAAHRANLVHGDFKPDNVLIGEDGRVLVTDFAMTRHVLEARLELELAGTNADTPAGESSSDSQTHPTSASGQAPLVKGTPAYMAPEQFDGEIPDARADQFAFCVALWEALTGDRPFRGRTWKQLREAIGRGPQTSGRRPGPRALWTALERGLKVDPNQRWPDLEQLLDRLRWVQDRRRRWALIGLGVGLTSLGFAAAAILAMQREPPPRVEIARYCEPADSHEEIYGIWTDERRRAIETSFAATGLPYAHETARTSIEALDRWAAEWKRARSNRCEDEKRARFGLICLERNRAHFAALVDILADADQTTVEIAGELIEQLPVDDCVDYEPPEHERTRSDRQRSVLNDLIFRVNRIELLWMVARTEEALALVDPLQQEAEAHAATDLVAELRHLRGLLLLDTGDHDRAIDELLAAALVAREAELPRREAEIWMAIADAESRIGGDSAGRWLDIAAPLVETVGDLDLEFDLANHRGLVALAEGKPSEAAEWFEQAHAKQVPGDPDLPGHTHGFRIEARPFRRLKALANLAVALANLDRLDRAAEVLDEALALADRNWPPGHPEFGLLYNSRAGIAQQRGRTQDAKADYERAYESLSENFGAEHVYARSVTSQLALIEAELGNCDEARRRLDELIPALREDPNSVMLLPNVLIWRAMLCNETQADSRALADEALERATAVFPEGSSRLAKVASHRGWVLLALEDYAGAEQAFLAARPAVEAELPEEHIDRVGVIGGLGAALAGLGRTDEARPLLEQGIAGLRDRRPARAEQLQKALDGLSAGPK